MSATLTVTQSDARSSVHRSAASTLKGAPLTADTNAVQEAPPAPAQGFDWRKGTDFYLTLIALFATTFICALDAYGLPAALTQISTAIGNESQGIWTANSLFIGMFAYTPVAANCADVFGRRPTMLGSLAITGIGAIVCATANSFPVMIVGRSIEGIGQAGMYSLPIAILTDITTLKERGYWQWSVNGGWLVGAAAGPVLGGLLADKWRWLFAITPIMCAITAALYIGFYRVHTPREKVVTKLARFDWLGNFVFVASSVALFLALTWGGVTYRWTSYRVLTPLCLSVAGFVAFVFIEKYYAAYPTVPLAIFKSVTACSGYFTGAVNSVVGNVFLFFAPPFLQVCKLQSPLAAGGIVAGGLLVGEICGMTSGVIIARTGKYKLINFLAWPVTLAATLSWAFLRPETPLWAVVLASIVYAVAHTFLADARVYPVQAGLPQRLNAAANGFANGMRMFGATLGITIAASIIQNDLSKTLPGDYLSRFPTSEVGPMVAYSDFPDLESLAPDVRQTVQDSYADAMSIVFFVMTGWAGVALVVSLLMKELPLREELDEAHALEQRRRE